eukprot:TCONS_00055549-protein
MQNLGSCLFVFLAFLCGVCMNSKPNLRYTSTSGKITARRRSWDGVYSQMDEWHTIEPTNKGKVFTILKWKKFNIKDTLPYCRVVFVNVYVGCGSSSHFVGGFCDRTPFPIYSPDGCIKINYQDKSSRHSYFSGFEAVYETYPVGINMNSHFSSCYPKSSKITQRAGLIGSPNWPHSYNKVKDFRNTNKCTWEIYVPGAKNIAVYVIDLNLAKDYNAVDNSCPNRKYDYFSIHYKKKTAYDLESKTNYYCGKTQGYDLDTQSNSLKLGFHRNSRYSYHQSPRFLIGYIAYGDQPIAEKKESDPTSMILIIILSAVIIFVIVIVAWKYCNYSTRCKPFGDSDCPAEVAAEERQNLRNGPYMLESSFPNNNGIPRIEETRLPDQEILNDPSLSDLPPPTYTQGLRMPSPATSMNRLNSTDVEDDDQNKLPSYQDVISNSNSRLHLT